MYMEKPANETVITGARPWSRDPWTILLSLLFSLVVVCRAVALKPAQHAALMTIYNDTGVGTADYPRFSEMEDCIGSRVACADGDIVFLCVSSVAFNLRLSVGLTERCHSSLASNQLTTVPSEVGQLMSLTEL